MPTFNEIHDQIYANATFEKQVVVACLSTADQIIREDPATEDHEARLNWARVVISNPTFAARKMMPVMMVNPVVQSGTFSDTDILWLVSTNISIYSVVM